MESRYGHVADWARNTSVVALVGVLCKHRYVDHNGVFTDLYRNIDGNTDRAVTVYFKHVQLIAPLLLL
jgi:hypothetical protein